jgi:hypothetical protein
VNYASRVRCPFRKFHPAWNSRVGDEPATTENQSTD